MARKRQEMQRIIRLYRESTGDVSVNMHEVAKFAAKMGWPLPTPKSALDRLAEQFSIAAREETRHDEVTGRPYRSNLAYTEYSNGSQLVLWADIDQAPRPIARKAFVWRREQMIGDAVQLTLDVDHWNRVHNDDEPIEMPLDFAPDVEWRLAANDPGEKVA
ncbi:MULTISPECIES: hypothetical protein [Xanthomonas translucens group]|uniref:Uncharacterized protein n=1 Tax=Xanthomonas translucens pv. translucens DSM 18974 TaxID=1261556 RepID=A0A1C3TMA4_XANCT|nr:hypothetical protein [Xanthomonas translucens]MCC8445684.1 hypothetical protein [Xanthomonas translucens pv. translucens]MCT8287561.1 hypothetical protein [Xanthomonas translucens pv. translucens]MCT8305219.1 hypothetical protein [Xanthomonas translucens pv. translucens]UKE48512.1 hypothetical protein KHA79_07910 [Xanthomonas translucens pv. cerealis]UNT99580.1 hypothetical protein KBQ49_02380 [Xanthomonas translucens pv. translucens]